MVAYIAHRYRTADPFKIADQLNVELRWADLGDEVLGKTQYIAGRPLIFLSDSIKGKPKMFFVMAHELGHVILHADVSGYYKVAYHGDDKAEHEADQFAGQLLMRLYWEENRVLPETIQDLAREYGVPVFD